MLDAKMSGSIADVIFRAIPNDDNCFGRIVSSKNDMKIEAIDSKNILLSHIIVKPRSFDVLKASEFELVLKDINKLRESMKLAKSSKQISIKHQKESNYLAIAFDNITRKMAVSPGINSKLKENKLELPFTIKLKAKDLSRGIRAAQSISDNVTFSADSEKFEISAISETDSVSIQIGLGKSGKEYNISNDNNNTSYSTTNKKISSSFPIEYLSKVAYAFNEEDEIAISIGNNMPAKIAFTPKDNSYEISFLIAPIIQKDYV
ncbi:MAG: hypothetical protein QXT63_03370 [Thermoplasmata archaeon]